MRHLIPIIALVLMVTVLFGCDQAPVSMESEPQQTTEAPTTEAPTTEPPTTEPPTEPPTTDPPTEPPTTEPPVTDPPGPVYAEPQNETWSGLTYEDYFATDRDWADLPRAPINGPSVTIYEDRVCLNLRNGYRERELPNTEDWESVTNAVYSGFSDEVFFVKDGILYMQDSQSGARRILYDQGEVAPYFDMVCQEIIYFAVQDQGIIKLCRLFLPENRLDILYEYESDPVPIRWLLQFRPETTLGNVAWRSINPKLTPYLMEVLADPNNRFVNGTFVGEEIWTENLFYTLPPYDYYLLNLMEAMEKYYGIPYGIQGSYNMQTGEVNIFTIDLKDRWSS